MVLQSEAIDDSGGSLCDACLATAKGISRAEAQVVLRLLGFSSHLRRGERHCKRCGATLFLTSQASGPE